MYAPLISPSTEAILQKILGVPDKIYAPFISHTTEALLQKILGDVQTKSMLP